MKDYQQSNELVSQWWDNQQKLLNQWLNTATSKSDIEAPVVEIFNQTAHTQEKNDRYLHENTGGLVAADARYG